MVFRWEAPFWAPLTVRGELCPFCLGKPHRHRVERHQGCGLPVEDACFAYALSMLERNKGMQECVWGLTHLPGEACSYTCLHLPVRAGAYSRLFHWLRQGLTRRPEISALRKAFGASKCLHVFLCVADECSVSVPEHPAKHKHLHGKLYLIFEVFFIVHTAYVGAH